MKRRFVVEWAALTAAIGIIVPPIMFFASYFRMMVVGDKPAENAKELEYVEFLQWLVPFATYIFGVAAFSYLVLVILKRK